MIRAIAIVGVAVAFIAPADAASAVAYFPESYKVLDVAPASATWTSSIHFNETVVRMQTASPEAVSVLLNASGERAVWHGETVEVIGEAGTAMLAILADGVASLEQRVADLAEAMDALSATVSSNLTTTEEAPLVEPVVVVVNDTVLRAGLEAVAGDVDALKAQLTAVGKASDTTKVEAEQDAQRDQLASLGAQVAEAQAMTLGLLVLAGLGAAVGLAAILWPNLVRRNRPGPSPQATPAQSNPAPGTPERSQMAEAFRPVRRTRRKGQLGYVDMAEEPVVEGQAPPEA